jgi:YHS domain-containing protein
MNPSRAFLQQIFLAFVFLLLPGAASFAQSDPSKPLRVVLKGHDPVAYFTDGKPVKGDPKISYDWDEGRYLFSKAGNRDKFAANPERYAPQFDGYCTGTMAGGRGRAETDPEAWIISDGRLYLFGEVKFKDMAEKDPAWLAGKIVAANEHWRAKK